MARKKKEKEEKIEDKFDMSETIENIPKEDARSKSQLYWVLGTMAFLIVVILIAYSAILDFKKIDYEGLTFTKEKFGEIPLYHYSYVAKVRSITGNAISYSNNKVELYLRTDPRENNIPVEGGEIEFPIDRSLVYVGIGEEGITGCPYSIIGLASLSSFLSQNGYNIKAGALDEESANENNLEHVSCEKYPDNGVIILQGGEFTSINKEGSNCYEIKVAQCESLPAIEKFIVQAIIDARERVTP